MNLRELEEIKEKIYKTRQVLYKIIDNKENLLDIEVIIASKKLDDVLNEYNHLLRKKN